MAMNIRIESTPNPATLKFVLSFQIANISLEIPNVEEAYKSPLAQKLFGFPWMSRVFIGSDFVSVTKQDWVEWEILASPLADLILQHFQSGNTALADLLSEDEDPISKTDELQSTDSDIVRKIKKILNSEIRPMVALDGGDVRYSNFEESTGVLSLEMRGACAGCPSSAVTLKEGIEVRIRQAIPEVQQVIAN